MHYPVRCGKIIKDKTISQFYTPRGTLSVRNLTIKRAESDLGGQTVLALYIEDPASEEHTVNGIACRKLGELKNGEERTFQIGENSLKLLATADGSDDGHGISFQLPEGDKDVSLALRPHSDRAGNKSGNKSEKEKNSDSDGTGSAVAEGTDDTGGATENKFYPGKSKGFIAFLIAFAAVLIAGLAVAALFIPKKEVKEKKFSSDGMEITLTDEFEKDAAENYTAVFSSKDAAVFVLKEPFTLAEKFDERTADQYADMMIGSNGLGGVEKFDDGDAIRWEHDYTNPETGRVYRCRTYVYKTSDAFWTVQFATLKEKSKDYAEKIDKWAGTIEFSD